ncbi:MAG: DUF4132 domain-containing protein, partial [Bacteroidota bacterium]
KIGKTTLTWRNPNGKLQKSIPAYAKEYLPKELKTLKATKKDLEKALTAQRDRIDRLFRSQHSWDYKTWQARYLDHGLMSFITKKIIWKIEDQLGERAGIYLADQWQDHSGNIAAPQADSKISLWHPALESSTAVQTWRNFLIDQEIQQPLKQVFREIYLLTDAEINTQTYSNRMAAHILKQHQFNSLAKTRGWRYSLLGAYDKGYEGDRAMLDLAEYNMRAEFWVSEVHADDAFNETGIWLYVATDQVRFLDISNQHQVIDLANIPVQVFSEVMRDVDLFVGVASIGNDPNWVDSEGALERHLPYWNQYSFGSLTGVGKNRKAILEHLLPKLKIKDIAHLEDKFLVVKGKKRIYKIHLGSTNILMEPNDQYLCIVPDRSTKSKAKDVFLPFDGDSGLSLILSKAFLLADDDKITDRSIVSQINRW